MRKVFWIGLLCFALVPAYAADRTDLLGEWTFDDGTSQDTSGNGNHGDTEGYVVDGVSGKAFEFDGTFAITVPEFSENFVFDQAFTLEGWVYLLEGSQTMVRKGGSANFLLELGEGRTNDPGANLQFGFATDQVNIGSSITYGPAVPYAQWTYFAMTYDGSMLRGYMNGELVAENPVTGSALNDTSQELRFGNYSAEIFVGRLDEIRIWKRTLSNDEIMADFEELAPSFRTDLVGEWLFDDETAVDSTGNGNDGTIEGAYPVDGLSGKAFEFDGASQIVVYEFSDDFYFENAFSLAAWVKPQAGSATMIRKGGSANFLLELGVGRTNDPGTNPQFGFATDEVNIGSSIVYGPALPMNEWSLVTMTYDGLHLRGYINGVQVASNSVTGLALNDTSQELRFGNYSSEVFFGQLDDIRIWSRTLFPTEIKGIFQEHADKPDVSSFAKATRVFEDLTYSPGKPLSVPIEIVGQAGAVMLSDTPPEGWAVGNISHGGQLTDGAVTWDISDFTGEMTISYVVTPPETASESATFAGTIGESTIVGPDTLVPGEPVGIFENHMDIGDVAVPGEVTYDEATGTYDVVASGKEIWNHMDQFHFLYVRTVGDFTMQAKAEVYPIDGADEWMRGGIVVREDLTPQSAYAIVYLRSDFQMGYEWRPKKNIYPDRTSDLVEFGFQEGGMMLSRVGNLISLYFIDAGNGEPLLLDERELEWSEPLYVGLAVSAMNDSLGDGLGTTQAIFTDVEFEGTVSVSEWSLH